MSKSILLIDDNPRNNSGYIEELKKHYKVDVAMRFVIAERLINSRKYDVIVIDVMMPTNGLKSNYEHTAGFDFYSERLKPLLDNQNTKSLIIFYSYFSSTYFDMYFGEHKPENVFYIQKNEFLVKNVELLLGNYFN